MEIQGIGNAFASRFAFGNTMSVDINSAVHFVESFGVLQEDIPLNSMNFYNIARNVKEGKVKFIQAVSDGYITKPRPAACAWDPIGGISFNKAEVSLCPHNIQLENCVEEIPGWEGIYGQGNDVEDLLASEFGAKCYEELINAIYRMIGNDMAKISHLGKHPIIASAEASYTGDAAKFARIKKTMNVCGGWLTLVDALKAQGEAHYNVVINPDHVNGDLYTGDPDALFMSLTRAMTTEMRTLIANKRAYGIRPVIMVTGGIYDAYIDWLNDEYKTIPDMLYYKLNDQFCAQIGCAGGEIPEGIIGWKGMWIKRMDVWDSITSDIQVTHHRALLTVPKNLGIGLDVQELSGYQGMGLRVEQSKQLDKVGKLFASTNYRMGTGIIDDRFVVNASHWAA